MEERTHQSSCEEIVDVDFAVKRSWSEDSELIWYVDACDLMNQNKRIVKETSYR